MKSSKISLLYLVAILWLLSLHACAGGSNNKNTQPEKIYPIEERSIIQDVETIQLATIDSIPMRAPIKNNYDNIIFRSFECSEQFKKDYPDARKNCKESIISKLKNKKNYLSVTDNIEKPIPGKSLFIDMKIIDMRIVTESARALGIYMAGASYMDVLLKYGMLIPTKLCIKSIYTHIVTHLVHIGQAEHLTGIYHLISEYSSENIFLDLYPEHNKSNALSAIVPKISSSLIPLI